MAGKPGVIRLSFEQKYAVCEWLRNKREELQSRKWHMTELAKYVSEQTGHTLTDNVIKEILEVVGIKIESPTLIGGAASARAHVRIEELTKCIEGITEGQQVLDREFRSLREEEQSRYREFSKRMTEMQAQLNILQGAVVKVLEELHLTCPGLPTSVAGRILPKESRA